MPGSKRSAADRHAQALLGRIGEEFRAARLSAGLTMMTVAKRAGVSTAELSRIERAAAPWVDLIALQRIAIVVGLRIWVRAYPDGDAIRDQAHVGLELAFRAMVGPDLVVATEVPFPDPLDRRAWDMTLSDVDRSRAGVEFDTRVADAQAYLRRILLKRRDGKVDRLILVLLDTRSNRAAVAAARSMFEDHVVIEDRDARNALARGRLPDRDCLLFARATKSPQSSSSRGTRAGDT